MIIENILHKQFLIEKSVREDSGITSPLSYDDWLEMRKKIK